MAILAIIVALAVPQFMGYTEEAELTKLAYDAKLLENACEEYYIKHGDWPRLQPKDKPLDMRIVAAGMYKINGEKDALEPDLDAKYYDIDMKKLANFVTINADPLNYVLQNPVGSIYILDPQTNYRLLDNEDKKPIVGNLLHDESPGATISFSDREWIVLDQMDNGETYILLKDRDCQRPFQSEDIRQRPYNPSDHDNIAYYLNNNFYHSLSQKELVSGHNWDRVSIRQEDKSNGTNYGRVFCNVGLMSYQECEKYRTYYNDSILFNRVWWTRTLCEDSTFSSPAVWLVSEHGFPSVVTCASYSYDVRAALYLKSGTVVDKSNAVVTDENIIIID